MLYIRDKINLVVYFTRFYSQQSYALCNLLKWLPNSLLSRQLLSYLSTIVTIIR